MRLVCGNTDTDILREKIHHTVLSECIYFHVQLLCGIGLGGGRPSPPRLTHWVSTAPGFSHRGRRATHDTARRDCCHRSPRTHHRARAGGGRARVRGGGAGHPLGERFIRSRVCQRDRPGDQDGAGLSRSCFVALMATLIALETVMPHTHHMQSLAAGSSSSDWMSNQLQGFPSAPPFPPAVYPGVWTMDTRTQGAWRGRYGTSGYQVRARAMIFVE